MKTSERIRQEMTENKRIVDEINATVERSNRSEYAADERSKIDTCIKRQSDLNGDLDRALTLEAQQEAYL